MSSPPHPVDTEYRNPGALGSKRTALLGLVLCGGIGAALAFIIERPFEGQLSAVTILGFLELLLVTVLIRAAVRYRRRAAKRPLLSPQARRARALFLEELERSDIIGGVVRASHEHVEVLYTSPLNRLFLSGATAATSESDRNNQEAVTAWLTNELSPRVQECVLQGPTIIFPISNEPWKSANPLVGEIRPITVKAGEAPLFFFAIRDAEALHNLDPSRHDVRRVLSRLLVLASTRAHVDALAHASLDAARVMLPCCTCCIFKQEDDRSPIHLTPLDTQEIPPMELEVAFLETLPRLSYDSTSQEGDLYFTDKTPGLPAGLTAFLKERGFVSCRLTPILIDQKRRWGFIAFFSRFLLEEIAPRQRERQDFLLQLARTALERALLIRDIEDKQDRAALAERAGKIGIWDWDPRTKKVIWSEQMESVMGMEPGSFKGTYTEWSSRLPPEDLTRIESKINELFKAKAQDYYDSYRIKLPDGTVRWQESFGSIYYDTSGNPIRFVGTSSDITERREAQTRLEEERRRLELVLEAGELGFWDWHIPSGAVRFGGKWCSMLGYSCEDIAPRVDSWERLVHPDDMPAVQVRLSAHLSGKSSFYEAEHRLKRKDGSWAWVLDRGRVVERDERGNPIRALGIHADVSEQHASREALKEANKRKDEFLATLAHELRNPLAPLRTGLTVLKRNPSGPDAQRSRDMMERQLYHMVRLIDDLLDVARIRQGRLELKKSTVDLREIIESALESSKPLIESARHELSVTLPSKPVQLNGDSVRLTQVLTNLLSNAAKYTPDGGHISLTASRTNGTAEIVISDNGLGLPRHMLDAIFDMFGQVNRTLERSQGGLGIGLAIVKKIVELHGGDIRASSPGEGLGSTFTIHLPALPSQPKLSPIQEKPPPETAIDQHRVLVVDDNVDGAESLSLFISLLGHKVDVAHSGPEALELLSHGMPHVIFLDIGLPGLSGYEVAQRIRKLPLGDAVHLIALTGWGTDEDKQKALEVGFSQHLTKPVDPTVVERILNEFSAPIPGSQPEAMQPPAV